MKTLLLRLLPLALLAAAPFAPARAERIKIAEISLVSGKEAYTPGSSRTLALNAALATNGVDIAYLHGGHSSDDFGEPERYRFVSAGALQSVSGLMLFIAYDNTVYELVHEFPNEAPYRYSGQTGIVAKPILLRRRDDSSILAVCVIVGKNMNLTKSAYRTWLTTICTNIASNEYGANSDRTLFLYNPTLVGNEESWGTYFSDTTECAEVSRSEALVIYSSENVSVTATSTTFEDSVALGANAATVATLTFGTVDTKDPAVWIDVGRGRAGLGAEAVFSAQTQDIDAETATFAWTFGDGTSETTPTNSVAHAFAAPGTYTVSVSAQDTSMSEAVSSSDSFLVGAPEVWVAAGNANAVAPYATAETAAPDIHSAVDVSADGTTIHVLDGAYPVSNPVSLEFGIRLVGESGDPSRVMVTNTTQAASGTSNSGVLQLDHPDAFAANLTVAGGQIHHDQNYAGGVTIGSSGGMVSNCVVTTTKSSSTYGRFAGVLVKAGLLTHCRIEKGAIGGTQYTSYASGGCVTGSGRIENCLFLNDANPGQNTSVVFADGHGSLVNCTIVDCVVQDSGEGARDAHAVRTFSSSATVRNVLVANVMETLSGEKRAFGGASTNENAFAACASDLTEPVNEACLVGTVATLFRNYALGDLRPGDACIDRGITPGSVPAVDLAGFPRVVGRSIDIGCYESPASGTLILVK